jgi:sulfatase modifying factor 1
MGDPDGLPDQRPAHAVQVDEFWMAIFAVTRGEFELFLRETGAPAPACFRSPLFAHPRQPAVGVNWYEASTYARWLSERTGRRYRLPTEAERERATRGLTAGMRYPWGDAPSPDGRCVAVKDRPSTVEESVANSLGIHGLADGVHEWCSDWYNSTWYQFSPTENPAGPAEGTRRVSRGGSWRHQICTTASAARSSLPPELHYTDYGFRLIESA